MSHIIRRLIFYGFCLLFVIITPCILLYAQGYGFDWQKKTVIQTGALYIKSQPKNATVLIDGKIIEKTPCLIKHLKPNQYTITVKLNDYHSWQKTLKIDSNLVTEAREILLTPQSPILELLPILPSNRFKLSDNSQQIISWQKNQPDTIDYFDFNQYQQKQFKTANATIDQFNWSPDDKKILIQQKDTWFLIDLTNQKTTQLTSQNPNQSINKIIWHPSGNNKIFFLQGTTLFQQDLSSNTLVKISDNIFDFTIANNSLFYLKEPGYFLYSTNLTGENIKQLTIRPILQNNIKKTNLVIGPNGQIALVADNLLYLYKRDDRIFEIIQNDIHDAFFSPDGKKLLIMGSNEIWVIYLDKQTSQPQKEIGQKDLIVRLGQPILQVIWHPADSSHIIFTTQDAIKIAEIDNRDNINLSDFINAQNPWIQYIAKTKKLYFTDQQKLFNVKLN